MQDQAFMEKQGSNTRRICSYSLAYLMHLVHAYMHVAYLQNVIITLSEILEVPISNTTFYTTNNGLY